MKTDKNNCCNDPTLVESRQRSQNDMTATICFHCRRFVETNDKAKFPPKFYSANAVTTL